MAGAFASDEPEQVPRGYSLDLRERGTIFFRELAGPPGAPTLILLHGLAATGGLNWFTAFAPLRDRFHVIAPDLRGHGRGGRAGPFRLDDCADDVAALAAELGFRKAIIGGYSMGGPISQLVWQRHRPLVQGLVLAATSYRFVHGAQTRVVISSIANAFAQVTRLAEVTATLPIPSGLRLLFPTEVRTSGSVGAWGAAEMRRHSLRAIVEAALELGNYNAETWIGSIDVPTAVVLTSLDRAVLPIWQLRLARAIPGATLYPIAEGHVACGHALFGQVFAEACGELADRIAGIESCSTSRTRTA